MVFRNLNYPNVKGIYFENDSECFNLKVKESSIGMEGICSF